MIELSKERIEKILHEETTKKEDVDTILRGIYIRYMNIFERYFADIDKLSNDKIEDLKQYHEETKSLFRYYYMDIPMDVCTGIRDLEEKCTDILLGPDWHAELYDTYEAFKAKGDKTKGETRLKAEFAKQSLSELYSRMDYIFRDGFGTGSESAKEMRNGIVGLLFGKEK